VGTIDYEKLGLKKDFSQSSLGQNFLLGYANTGWWHYQIVSLWQNIEQGKVHTQVSIRGTYTPKNSTLSLGRDYRHISETQIEILTPGSIHLFRSSDLINDTYEIW